MKKTLLKASAIGFSLMPTIALAQQYSISNLATLLDAIKSIINTVTPVLISISVFAIIIGTVLYFVYLGNEDKKKEAMNFIMYGVIFLFLMLSIYGLVNILLSTFYISNNKIISPPQI